MCCDVLSEVEASGVEVSEVEVNATWYYYTFIILNLITNNEK